MSKLLTPQNCPWCGGTGQIEAPGTYGLIVVLEKQTCFSCGGTGERKPIAPAPDPKKDNDAGQNPTDPMKAFGLFGSTW
jgi:DnaJ-class molecular chaperone